MTLDFGLSEQIFAKAHVKEVTSVALWLGADVMLEYPLQEARELLVRTTHTKCMDLGLMPSSLTSMRPIYEWRTVRLLC